MYLLILRACDDEKQLVSGILEKKDGSKENFVILPGTAKTLEFEYGDKIVCVHGIFMIIIHLDAKKVVCARTMYDRYWMPNHEITLDENYMKENQREEYKLPLTGVNHRVHGGRVIR